jgi:metallo-beta-lactamase family protein
MLTSMKLTFAGAAGTVTGSLHRLEVENQQFLLDCGMFQGRRKEAEERNRDFPFDARSIDAVVLSHAHIDHSGRLPLLVRNGFRGPVYATPATIDLCRAMLRDTARILGGDAAFVNKHRVNEPAIAPLYSAEDAEATMPLFRPVGYHEPAKLGGSLTMESFDAGHMLGSSAILLTDGKTRLAYSGDVGRPGLPIVRDPEPLPPVDYLIMESTYGGRKHAQTSEAPGKLAQVVNDTVSRGGHVIVPAFAVGRTQQLVLLLHQLMNEHRLPEVPIFVDSPLAVNVTDVFRAHPECFDAETCAYLQGGEDPFGFRRLQYVRESSESIKLNDFRGPMIVISASGLCEAGRILHHLIHNIGNANNTVLLTGYQAENTLGRKLQDGMKNVRIFGIPTDVRARIESMDELSGHADSDELLAWMKSMTPTLKRVFLVHGEKTGPTALAASIKEKYGIEAVVAQPGQMFEL